ncbi:MAG: dienelactone hydrolase family protein [Pseudomonadales bacterium]|nr:dienelactone hydrolase family protein [Pseudomonadales bacterium]
MLHGITSSKDVWWQNEGPYGKTREYRMGLLEAGYVIVTPDARWHDQRIATADFKSPLEILGNQNWTALRSLIAGSVVDFSAILDEVEKIYPDLPIGVLGMSLGAIHSFALATDDTRIKLAVPVFSPIQTPTDLLTDIQPMTRAKQLTVPTLLLISDQDVCSHSNRVKLCIKQ